MGVQMCVLERAGIGLGVLWLSAPVIGRASAAPLICDSGSRSSKDYQGF